MSVTRPQAKSLFEALQQEGFLETPAAPELRNQEPGAIVERLLGSTPDGEKFARFLADYMGLEYLAAEAIDVAPELASSLALLDKNRLLAVPVREQSGGVLVVVCNPLDARLVERIGALLNRRVRLGVASGASLREATGRHLSANSRLGLEAGSLASIAPAAQPEPREDMRDAPPIVRLVDTLLRTAVERGASDVHIEARGATTHVRFRIDGVLQPAMEPLSVSQHDAIVTRIKVMSDLDVAESKAAQDGRFSLKFNGNPVDFRASVLPGTREGVVLRLLRHVDLAESSWRLEQLGFPDAIVAGLRRAVRQPQGLVLITGPTGSGKTTTLYAAMAELDSRTEKIITIEDPVEYTLDGVTQISVNERKKFTFANGLRSILRHDPDKIMVGEIRDRETAEIAVQSALTGHLVLSTVHANGALEAVNRFSHMGVERAFVVDGLAAVFAQRLLRVLCPACRKTSVVKPEDELLDHERALLAGREIFAAQGCAECNFTGYRGREAIGEYLRFTPEFKDALLSGESRRRLHDLARMQGMQTLRESAIENVLTGRSSLEEIARVTVVD